MTVCVSSSVHPLGANIRGELSVAASIDIGDDAQLRRVDATLPLRWVLPDRNGVFLT
jgi:hypothetical protein